MKKSPKVAAALCLAALFVSCSSPTSSPPGTDGTTTKNYTLTATVDGTTPFSSGALVTCANIGDPTKYLVVITGTSAALGQSMQLTFPCPSVVTTAVTLGPRNPNVVGQYYLGNVGSAAFWTTSNTGDTISVTVNSFSIGAADTTISIDFSYTAWGGPNGVAQTAKKISAGTLRKQ